MEEFLKCPLVFYKNQGPLVNSKPNKNPLPLPDNTLPIQDIAESSTEEQYDQSDETLAGLFEESTETEPKISTQIEEPSLLLVKNGKPAVECEFCGQIYEAKHGIKVHNKFCNNG